MACSGSPNTPIGTKIRSAIKLLKLYPGVLPTGISVQYLVLDEVT